MSEFESFEEVIRKLRSPGGCPWDREQTHESLKPACIEEAAELIGAINMYGKTKDPSNMKEELGDLLLQVVMHAVIAEEEGLFTMDDVIRTVREKMIRRHPHVFGNGKADTRGEVLQSWEQIKLQEKKGKADEKLYLGEAFDEARELIEVARRRKGLDQKTAAGDMTP